jgi:hypothetical protein
VEDAETGHMLTLAICMRLTLLVYIFQKNCAKNSYSIFLFCSPFSCVHQFRKIFYPP